jgi:hypothetical protein
MIRINVFMVNKHHKDTELLDTVISVVFRTLVVLPKAMLKELLEIGLVEELQLGIWEVSRNEEGCHSGIGGRYLIKKDKSFIVRDKW